MDFEILCTIFILFSYIYNTVLHHHDQCNSFSAFNI